MNNTDQKPLTPTEKKSIVSWFIGLVNPFRETAITLRVRDTSQYGDDPHTIEITHIGKSISPETLSIVLSNGPNVFATTAAAVPDWAPTPIREAAKIIRHQLEVLRPILETIETD